MRDQDRALWDDELIAEGLRLVEAALGTPPAGRFALLAAIGAVIFAALGANYRPERSLNPGQTQGRVAGGSFTLRLPQIPA
jgi:hypothetical protein